MSGKPCDEKSPIRWLFHSTSEKTVDPPIVVCVAFPLREGDLIPVVQDQVVCGPEDLQVEQIPYPGGNNAYPVHPPLLCSEEKFVCELPPLTVIVTGVTAEPPQLSHS